jgi:hypothetical protein
VRGAGGDGQRHRGGRMPGLLDDPPAHQEVDVEEVVEKALK